MSSGVSTMNRAGCLSFCLFASRPVTQACCGTGPTPSNETRRPALRLSLGRRPKSLAGSAASAVQRCRDRQPLPRTSAGRRSRRSAAVSCRRTRPPGIRRVEEEPQAGSAASWRPRRNRSRAVDVAQRTLRWRRNVGFFAGTFRPTPWRNVGSSQTRSALRRWRNVGSSQARSALRRWRDVGSSQTRSALLNSTRPRRHVRTSTS